MSPFLRKVRAASGATSVQIVEKRYGRRRIVEHLGSAHTQAELAVLLEVGREKLSVGQPMLNFEDVPVVGPGGDGAAVEGESSRLLAEVIRTSWDMTTSVASAPRARWLTLTTSAIFTHHATIQPQALTMNRPTYQPALPPL